MGKSVDPDVAKLTGTEDHIKDPTALGHALLGVTGY